VGGVMVPALDSGHDVQLTQPNLIAAEVEVIFKFLK
jgi:hypothetical protein